MILLANHAVVVDCTHGGAPSVAQVYSTMPLEYDTYATDPLPDREPFKPVVGRNGWIIYLPFRAGVEFVAALVLIVVSAPVIFLAAAVVRLTSPGRAFYAQTRLGYGGRVYTMYKIRSMYDDCERYSGPCWASEDDPRVTPVGRFLRATHIDELPQLVNVLWGEMSLIGPRPERPELVPDLERDIPRYRERLGVRPGRDRIRASADWTRHEGGERPPQVDVRPLLH